ncbi:3-dehydroquinate synthase [Allobranchiibius sp. CTAmp26]|uniref:3-dehydroquinate synthase n=1 Tax=Allobranchiibius sp. CTAmp26 TaxID=2815214 RepID=UPI001AA14A0E|nr:3-dehydroquinate synthase [Allobranchiibius sp. CTAmp26]MBO1754283.1 3-dehydroquinate synthase [Allobranchiibius sp. CTAmp26]
MTVARIPVGSAYDVLVGHGVLEQLPEAIPADATRILLLHPPALADRVDALAATLRIRERAVLMQELPDAEAAKTADVAARLWSQLGEAGFTRTDVVVGFGGGATTDLAGFVAATWLRGIRVVQVPTTLLGMVDAAVGGKTGINTPEGKNLVGAFHEPVSVLCDLDLLATLPRADLVAGLAEVVKCGFIADPRILELVTANPAAAADPAGDVLPELVRRAVAVKAEVVAADLKEASLREILNYGHTFAHAIEQVEHYTWRHGDAVSVGMVYVAELAGRAGLLHPDLVAQHRRVLSSLGLPTAYRGGRWEDLLAAMRRDKKTRGDLLRFVALTDIAAVTRLEGPAESDLRAAYDAVSDTV